MLSAVQFDNGSHLKNKIVQEWHEHNGVAWVFHLPYRPQSNGMVERWNGLLKWTLELNLYTEKWSKALTEAVWCLNIWQTPTRCPVERAHFSGLQTTKPLKPPLSACCFSQRDAVLDWNNNHVIQFMNIISQMGNESNCWCCLHHSQSLHANSVWLVEPVPETSWYQSKVVCLLPNTLTYKAQPFKAHSYDKMPWCIVMPKHINTVWEKQAFVTMLYSWMQTLFQMILL